MARPKKPIDAEQVRKLARLSASHAEIGAVLGCSADTLERRFAAAIKEGRESGKMSLRRKQFKLAMEGNVTMLIWLGKQYLDQRDKQTHEHSGPDGKPIETKSSRDLSDEQLDARIKSLMAKGSE